jgi:hypothetical protein
MAIILILIRPAEKFSNSDFQSYWAVMMPTLTPKCLMCSVCQKPSTKLDKNIKFGYGVHRF